MPGNECFIVFNAKNEAIRAVNELNMGKLC